MSRSLYLPYRASNPRTVRGARKRGWTVARPDPKYAENTSWLGLNLWCEQGMKGYWVSSFQLREFAFEKQSDALMFKLKWG